MSNLLVTNLCNRDCAYCFAVPYRRANSGRFLAEGQYQRFLDYLDRSGIDQVRLIGGEPTLHPQFDSFIRSARRRGRSVVVFTNGFMPERALEALLDLPEGACHVLVNVTTGEGGPLEQRKTADRQGETLRRLGSRAQLSFTVHQLAFDLTEAIDLIDKTNCQRSIRLGIAHPAGVWNRYIHPKHYRTVGLRIASFTGLLTQRGVTLELDCGFVRCMFSQEELDALKQCGAHLAWRCSPVIDIGLDGEAIPCFPLAELEKLDGALERTAGEIREEFNRNLRYYRVVGIYPECSTCSVRVVENCSGGCLASACMRLRGEGFRYHFNPGLCS
jgi:MoaA/NifB/PqqE/SkfB family radical SAM enzyme